MWQVGLDVHLRQTAICIPDGNGKVTMRRAIRGSWDKVLLFLAGVNHPFGVVFAAGNGYGYLYDRLRRIARRVVVAHPGHLRLIFRCKRRNDRVDALKLAIPRLRDYLDEVPPVHVPAAGVRAWRCADRTATEPGARADAGEEPAAGASAQPRDCGAESSVDQDGGRRCCGRSRGWVRARPRRW